MNKFALTSIAALAVAAIPAQAATVLDDFDRADALALGPNWTQQAGTSSIAGNRATGTDLALATYNGASSNSVTFDIFNNGSSTQYIAAVLGFGGTTDNYFVKVQNNGGGSGFDTFGFYTGNNTSVLFDNLTDTFTEGSVTVSFSGADAMLTIDPLGGAQQVYNFTYGFAADGTGVGLGFFGAAEADNFGIGGMAGGIPEPTTWAMLIFGFGAVGGAMRRKAKVTTKVSYA